jgi:superfamily II DNA or RNA helicase
VSPVPQIFPLREYQQEAVDAVESAWEKGLTRPAVVQPTGTGKTVIMAHLAARAHERGERTLILVHRDELVHQTLAKLHGVAPRATFGVVKANRREVDASIIVGSVQTLSREKRRAELVGVDRILADEIHLSCATGYRAVLDHYGVPTAGFTATMMRADKKKLGDIWDEIVYTRSTRWAIENGFLVDVRGKSVVVDGLDLGSVKVSHGDFQDQALATALELSNAAEATAESYIQHAKDRQGIIFAPTVASAFDFSRAFNAAGIVTAVITGDTPSADRAAVYRMFEAGSVQCLSSVGVLTTGFDAPWASCAVIARPTHSAGLFIQMAGRILRPWTAGGKRDALILDVVGAAAKHSLAHVGSLTTSSDDDEKPLELREDETLLEAIQRREKTLVHGKLVLGDIDLFRDRSTNWLRTDGGVWFISTTLLTYFLWQDATGAYTVGVQPKQGGKAERLYDGLTLEAAMAWAETEATDEDPSLALRAASWRKGNRAPSDGQVSFARGLGIAEPETMTKRDLSDQISIKVASRSLDRRFAPRNQTETASV